MSTDPRHLPGARRTPRDNFGRAEAIEASLEAVGLISNRPLHKPKRKAVEFKTAASGTQPPLFPCLDICLQSKDLTDNELFSWQLWLFSSLVARIHSSLRQFNLQIWRSRSLPIWARHGRHSRH